MKRFFRTSAIIACFALFSIACDRDVEFTETVYSGDPVVPASSLNELYSGNGKIYAEWEICDNENVSATTLSWTNSDGDSGSYTVEGVTPRQIASYTIEPVTAGDYTVTLTNLSEIEVITMSVSRVVTVFDETTYAYSSAIEYTDVVHDGSNATIYWGETPEDCVGVLVTYARWGATAPITSTLQSTTEGYTILVGANANQTISYQTCYQPAIAMDNEYVLKDMDDVEIPSSSPSSPTDVAVRPGSEKMEVTWSADKTNDYFYKSIIEYGYEGGVTTSITIDKDDVVDVSVGSNVMLIEGLEAGKSYTVTVYNSDSGSDSKSLGVVFDDVEIYDMESLAAAYESSMPTVSLSMLDDVLYVSVAQSTNEGAVECDYITFNYQYISGDGTDTSKRAYLTISDFTTATQIANAQSGSKYTYSATFLLPEGALDDSTTIEMHGDYESTYDIWPYLPTSEYTE